MKKKLWIPLLAAAILLAGLWLWYARPMTLEELNPGVELGQCVKIWAHQDTGSPWETRKEVELLPGDPAFDSLTELLEGRTFRRQLWKNLAYLFTRSSYRRIENGDFMWDMTLYFEEISLPNGETVQGGTVTLRNFYGDLDLPPDIGYIKTVDHDQWLSDVRAIILEAEAAVR